jgi:hypothetical protein
MANVTHPIKAVTIALAATPQNIATDLGLTSTANATSCSWFGIQNKDTASIFLQESAAAAAADSVEITPGQLYRPGAAMGAAEDYDLREYWIRATNNGAKYVIERKRL